MPPPLRHFRQLTGLHYSGLGGGLLPPYLDLYPSGATQRSSAAG